MKIEESIQRNGESDGPKLNTTQIETTISEAFKPKKLKDPSAPLRKYIDAFTKYEEKGQEIIVEEDDNVQTPASFFAKKIDKATYCKDLQRCMKKWNKNKNSVELNEIFSKLTRDASESESTLRLQKDNMSTYSAPSVKEDTKKRKKGSTNVSNFNFKDNKDFPQLRKMTENAIDNMPGSTTNKEHKKLKDKENNDELLYMFYEAPLKDQDYEVMFKTSVHIYLKIYLRY